MPSSRVRGGGAALVAALAIAALPGCATLRAKAPSMTSAQIREQGRVEGLRLTDPLELDPDVADAAARSVGFIGTPQGRVHSLLTYLNGHGYMNFAYLPNRSLTAREAFRERRGDCMAYTNLFVALARRIGLPAYFVHVTEVSHYYEKGGWFFVSSHVAAGVGTGPDAVVVDFAKEISDWRLAMYESIDDGAALALFYNNTAVELMTSGHTSDAGHLFRFLLEREPSVVELYNNLGVLLNRQGKHEEAREVLDQGIARFPAYEPLYTNALRAADALGRPDLVASYATRGQALATSDPYFLFARAMAHFSASRFDAAAEQFARASDRKPDSPVILAWLARSYLSAGRTREAQVAYARARRLAPAAPALDDLARDFPELRAPAAD
jgi:tetratricopeptide (TPR) repeat protein